MRVLLRVIVGDWLTENLDHHLTGIEPFVSPGNMLGEFWSEAIEPPPLRQRLSCEGERDIR